MTMTAQEFRFTWQAPGSEEHTETIELDSNGSGSKTILKMKEVFMGCINAHMEEQNLNKEEVALFEEVVSEGEDTVGKKRERKPARWNKSQKRKTSYGKKSR